MYRAKVIGKRKCVLSYCCKVVTNQWGSCQVVKDRVVKDNHMFGQKKKSAAGVADTTILLVKMQKHGWGSQCGI